jgi:N-acetylglucosamine kinase-like BadF-type ATPase
MFESMIRLIADSGSTKTEWVGISGSDVVFKTHTSGLNPFQVSDEEFIRVAAAVIAEVSQSGTIQSLSFYGAGCTPLKIPHVKNLLHQSGMQNVEVADDIQAVVDGCLPGKSGVAVILGTGANSGYFENGKLVEKVPALGYVLGDEGSGAALGKALLHAYYNQLLPAVIMDAMNKKFDLKREIVLEQVYRQPYPNRYLASFATFIHAHLNVPAIYDLVRKQFELCYQFQLNRYPNVTEVPVAISGSVGFHFSPLIGAVLSEYGITNATFYQSPVDGLVAQMFASAE